MSDSVGPSQASPRNHPPQVFADLNAIAGRAGDVYRIVLCAGGRVNLGLDGIAAIQLPANQNDREGVLAKFDEEKVPFAVNYDDIVRSRLRRLVASLQPTQ